MIRDVTTADAEAIARIYNHYVCESVVTFEESAIAPDEMVRRIQDIQASGLPWLVKQLDGIVVGYAYAGPWKSRSAYRLSVESTVYIEAGCMGRGIGFELYSSLLEALRATRTHAVIGGIALPNAASIALHEKLGFRKIGQFHEVGRKFERWVDVGYWQLLL